MRKIKTVQPTEFQIKISSCGTNSFAGTYHKWKDRNALRLMCLIVAKVTKDFVGKDIVYQLRYDLACRILRTLQFDEKKLLKHIKDSRSKFKYWDLDIKGDT
jgi:hypothetical protein